MNGHLSISVSLKDTPEILRVINLLQSLLPVEKPKLLPPLNPISRNVFSDVFLTDEQIQPKDLVKTRKELANESRRKKSLLRKRGEHGRWVKAKK
jgi:hypothetical protein